MATTITVEKNAEYLQWPRMCVCCGGVDEIDVEVIVPDTVPRDRDLSEITSAHVPHCYDCVAHAGAGLSGAQLFALLVALAFGLPILGTVFMHLPGGVSAVAAAVIAAAVVASDFVVGHRLMKRQCTARKAAFAFIHPSSEDVTTIRFANDHFARAFKAINLGGAYEP